VPFLYELIPNTVYGYIYKASRKVVVVEGGWEYICQNMAVVLQAYIFGCPYKLRLSSINCLYGW
jgi:hypothetical protein